MKKYLKFFSLLLISLASQAQKSTVDFQTWYDASLKLDMKKGWEISGQYRLRLNQNSSNYRGSYFFLAGEKKINKYFKVLANYRLALVEGDNYHRFLIGANAQFKAKDFTFFTHPMLQYQKQYFVNDDSNPSDSDTHLRLRTGLKYKINKRWDSYIYAEPFFKIKQGSTPNATFWQNSVGISYEYLKNKHATLYYIWQPEVNKKYPDTNNVLGISLDFNIKMK
jgi:hypothetical protein